MSNYLNIFIMRKVSIPDHVLQELADDLVKITGAQVAYKSRVVMCIKGGDHQLPFDVLREAKNKFGDILKDYSILWMADNPTLDRSDSNTDNVVNQAETLVDVDAIHAGHESHDKPQCVILLDGPSILTIWLTRRFGGATGGSNLWLVYNHSYVQSHYGYKGDKLPDSGEIISFLEQLFNCH